MYIIIFIIISYVVISIFTAILFKVVMHEQDDNISAALGLMWFIGLPLLILCVPFVIIKEILKKL